AAAAPRATRTAARPARANRRRAARRRRRRSRAPRRPRAPAGGAPRGSPAGGALRNPLGGVGAAADPARRLVGIGRVDDACALVGAALADLGVDHEAVLLVGDDRDRAGTREAREPSAREVDR